MPRKKKRVVKSVPQRQLMGYAYACATKKKKDCPPAIKSIVKSFLKKDKEEGLKSLRRMAKTKHASLSPTRVTERKIANFDEFIFEELGFFDDGDDQSSDAIFFLYSLKDSDLTELVNEFVTIHNKEDKKEYIDEIVKLVKTKFTDLDDKTIDWIDINLKKRIT